MDEVVLLQAYLAVGALLFGLGLAGFLVRRNVIVMFLCAEMMLQGVSLSLIAWGRFQSQWSGQMLVVFIITVAACEAGIALVMVLMLCKHAGNLDIASWQQSREDGQNGVSRSRSTGGDRTARILAQPYSRRATARGRPGA